MNYLGNIDHGCFDGSDESWIADEHKQCALFRHLIDNRLTLKYDQPILYLASNSAGRSGRYLAEDKMEHVLECAAIHLLLNKPFQFSENSIEL